MPTNDSKELMEGAPRVSIADILERTNKSQKIARTKTAEARGELRRLETELRVKVTKWVVVAFLVMVGFAVFTVWLDAAGLFAYSRVKLEVTPIDTQRLTDDAITILQGILLPVVTLVLGYYFGRGGE